MGTVVLVEGIEAGGRVVRHPPVPPRGVIARVAPSCCAAERESPLPLGPLIVVMDKKDEAKPLTAEQLGFEPRCRWVEPREDDPMYGKLIFMVSNRPRPPRKPDDET
jgi:hypothetical protein